LAITEEQKRRIEAFVEQRCRENDKHHQMKHMKEVVARALWLAKEKNADIDACWASAMLHDIAKAEKGDHGDVGAAEAKAFLLGIGVDGKTADMVYDAIYFHNKHFVGGPIERQILWDADKWETLSSGFEERIVDFFKAETSDKRKLAELVEREYLIFKGHFHTKEAVTNEEKYRPAIERRIAELKQDAA
jgi:HD superfamily phosphodiesterase